MIRRVLKWRRPRRAALLTIGALAAAGLIASVALALVSDAGTYSVIVPNKETSSALVPLDDGDAGNDALVKYIGSNAQDQASGTGLFDPFVRLQGDPTERGFNTDGAIQAGFDTKTGKWTHAVKATAIPIVDCDGDPDTEGDCWELFVDINESNTAKYIGLTKVEIYFATSNTLTDYPFDASEATLQYEFNGLIKIHDVNQGSGRGDLLYLVPLDGIDPFDSDDWFVLYSEWGSSETAPDNKTFASEGGFEEWKVRKAPNLSIVKTADNATVNAGQDIGFTITVTNNGAADATGVEVNDPLPNGTGLDWSIESQSPAGSCSIDGSPPSETLECGPLTLAAGGGSLTVHVTSATTGDSCGLYDNTATFTSTNAGSGSDDASVTVQCGAIGFTKTAKHKGAGSPNLVATFTVVDALGATHTVTTNSSGVGCAGGVAIGMTQSITETGVPTGYSAPTIANVNVASGSCSSGVLTGGTNVNVENTPLTDVDIDVDSLHDGATQTTIVCDGTETVVNGDGSVVVANDAAPNAPGVITCTISIDP